MDDSTRRFVLYCVGILAAMAIVAGLFLLHAGPKCGDGVCSKDESCCLDCGCAPGKVCAASSNTCDAKASCGDGICEQDENCCEDCGCAPGTRCDSQSNACVELTSAMCGNRVCDQGESSASCCLDCGCPLGEACNLNAGTCVARGTTAVCGNGVCDFGENVDSCCTDCAFCEQGTTCDPGSNTCLPDTIAVSNDEAIKLFKLTLLASGYSTDYINTYTFTVQPAAFDQRPALHVCTIIPATESTLQNKACGYVFEDRTVKGPYRYW